MAIPALLLAGFVLVAYALAWLGYFDGERA